MRVAVKSYWSSWVVFTTSASLSRLVVAGGTMPALVRMAVVVVVHSKPSYLNHLSLHPSKPKAQPLSPQCPTFSKPQLLKPSKTSPRPPGPSWEFPKLGVPYFGVLIRRILLFRYYIRVPYFRKLSPSKAARTLLCSAARRLRASSSSTRRLRLQGEGSQGGPLKDHGTW